MAWKGKRPTDFALQVVAEGDQHLKKICSEMLQGVVVRSPVDTGAFRGNNRVSINSADNSYDVSETDKAGNSTIATGNHKILQAKLGDQVYVQNNLPYAVALENGHSKEQAPKGIYALTFLSVSSKYK